MRLPPLNALKAFEASARRGSIALAAEALGVTPAAVSMQVKNLEQFFGKTLFHRTQQGLQLTDAGWQIYQQAASALGQLANMTEQALAHTPLRAWSLSVLPALAERWLPGRLAALKAQHPELRFQIRVEDDPVDLDKQRIDLRVTFGQNAYQHWASSPLFEDEVWAVCHRDQATTDPSQLSDSQLIHVDWGLSYATHFDWDQWFAAVGVARQCQQRAGYCVSNTSLALALVEQGLGVALVQKSLAQAKVAEGQICQWHPHALPLPYPYTLIYPQSLQEHPRLLQILSFLQQGHSA